MSNKWILSATEIETFELCRRKWAYQYLDRIKTPQSKAAHFGSSVHSFLQKYLTGYPVDFQTTEGLVVTPGLKFLPKGLSSENIEKPIFFSKHGLMFNGYIDFLEHTDSNTWVIGDHKTTSNLKRALTSHELKKNIQANVYAQWVFNERAAERVKLRWVYYQTTATPKTACVEAELTKQEAKENFAAIAKIGSEILAIVKERQPSIQQPKNISSCFKYGRCPFYTQCRRSRETATPPETVKLKSITREVKEYTVYSSCEPKPKSFHLFVDCMPTKNESPYEHTLELSELLKPVLTKLQTEKELSHYRLAGYGQHVGLIANYLSEHLQNSGYDNRTAILSSVKTPEGCDTLQTLVAAAGRVVRGF